MIKMEIKQVKHDDYVSGNICKYSFFESENITARRLNFSEIEEEFICDMRA